MKNKGYSMSISFDMLFKKHYCHKCGSKLEKEKVRRVVTKKDPDFYSYWSGDGKPIGDAKINVDSFIYVCPNCKQRYLEEEQDQIDIIQKKVNSKVLSGFEIIDNIDYVKGKLKKRKVISDIVSRIVLAFVLALMVYFVYKDSPNLITILIIAMSLYLVVSLWGLIRNKNKDIEEDKFILYRKLQLSSKDNRHLINASKICYCYHCKSKLISSEITRFKDHNTALCPICNQDTIIPTSIEDTVDKDIIEQMHEYWF